MIGFTGRPFFWVLKGMAWGVQRLLGFLDIVMGGDPVFLKCLGVGQDPTDAEHALNFDLLGAGGITGFMDTEGDFAALGVVGSDCLFEDRPCWLSFRCLGRNGRVRGGEGVGSGANRLDDRFFRAASGCACIGWYSVHRPTGRRIVAVCRRA